jgi:hypothetical protein
MTPEQEQYINAILDKSEEDLLYEIASGTLQGVTASAKPPYETKSADSREQYFRQLLRRVPSRPVSEYVKPVLEPHLERARDTMNLARKRLYNLLCDATTQKPNGLALEFCTGEGRNIIVNVASILLEHYNTAIAVGLPVAVYLVRNGIQKFCAIKPPSLPA